MDVIKEEDDSNTDTRPVSLPSEDQDTTAKMEDVLEPFTFVAVKQEVVCICDYV
jgi:hypothetical protein